MPTEPHGRGETSEPRRLEAVYWIRNRNFVTISRAADSYGETTEEDYHQPQPTETSLQNIAPPSYDDVTSRGNTGRDITRDDASTTREDTDIRHAWGPSRYGRTTNSLDSAAAPEVAPPSYDEVSTVHHA